MIFFIKIPKRFVVRSGIRTHALIRGPEISVAIPYRGTRLSLESGALDHSAILTLVKSDRVLAEINLALWDGAIGSTWKKKVGIP